MNLSYIITMSMIMMVSLVSNYLIDLNLVAFNANLVHYSAIQLQNIKDVWHGNSEDMDEVLVIL